MSSPVSTDELVGALTGRGRRAAGWLALLATAYVALVGCALGRSGLGLALAAAAAVAAEVLLRRRAATYAGALAKLGTGVVARQLVRGLALVVFAGRALPLGALVATTLAVLALAVLAAVRIGVGRFVARSRLPALLSRGLPLDLAGPRVPRALPAWVARPGGADAVAETLAALGLALAADVGPAAGWTGLGLAFALLAALTPVAVLVAHAQALRRARPRPRVAAAVQDALLAHAPAVLVYFGNTAAWRYQLEMWLRPLEALDLPAAIVVRDREVLAQLAPSSVPVVCVPSSGTLMGLPMPSPTAALYVGNGSTNVHLLRRPGLATSFIGHGDSDKPSSFNPFTRVYDEIWVAGPAGRARYAAAGVEIAPERIVEVGRPQLREVPREPDAVPLLTVLYAPTWEGWDDDPFHSSLETLGPALVRALLARPGVRVMYRPHPRTGHREDAIRRAHREVLDLLVAAGADPAAGTRLGPVPGLPPPVPGDLLDRVLHEPAGFDRAAQDARVADWTQRYWAATPGHRVLVEPAPELAACFAVADVLIADISSVTSDFLAADRPYAVVNVTDDPADVFGARTPSTAGGFVLDRDLAQLDAILAAATDTAAGGDADPTRTARAAVRAELLGPRTGDPVAPFRAAVRALAARPGGSCPLPDGPGRD